MIDSIRHSIMAYPETFAIVGGVAWLILRRWIRSGWAAVYLFALPVAVYVSWLPGVRPALAALPVGGKLAIVFWVAAVVPLLALGRGWR